MPEGHTIHRAARDQDPLLKGEFLMVSSPQGRFAEGAKRLDGLCCTGVEALGKHLLYRFEANQTLHIHLGLFGRIRKQKRPENPPKGAVRVRLCASDHVIDINGPAICEILDEPGLMDLFNRIGPDVLRADAEPERAYKRIAKSKTPIGRLIMDQSVMAGIGNIYRTELLWRQGIHPQTPGQEISRPLFDRLWDDATALLETGVVCNAIITVDGARPSKGRYREKVNIFAKENCPRCQGEIRKFDIANRRAFMCQTCQPARSSSLSSCP